MKIITDGAAYVQMNDLAFLINSDLTVPTSIYMDVLGDGPLVVNSTNRHDFYKFEGQSEIDYFAEADFIIDYDEVKDLSDEEIMDFGQNLADLKSRTAKKFNNMPDKEREQNMQLIEQCELLDYKMFSLRDFYLFKQGTIYMNLPDGIAYPSWFKNRGIKKKIHSLFGRRK